MSSSSSINNSNSISNISNSINNIDLNNNNVVISSVPSSPPSSTSSSPSSTSSKLADHYHQLELYFKEWINGVSEKWRSKLHEIRVILEKYSLTQMIGRVGDIPLTIGDIDQEELIPNNGTTTKDDKFLNTYTLDEITQYMKDFGIYKILNERGYTSIILIPDFSDNYVYRIKVTDETIKHLRGQNGLLIDMFIRRKDFYLNDFKSNTPQIAQENAIQDYQSQLPNYSHNANVEKYKWITSESSEYVLETLNYPVHCSVIEWLSLQDPKKQFSSVRPPLPGQLFPGLGVAKNFDNLFVYMATKSNRDCILNTPYRFYNAFMYQTREYFFIDPSIQAFFQSILNSLGPEIEKYDLAVVSWALEWGCVKETKTNKPIQWDIHNIQIRPISKELKSYVLSKEYSDYVKNHTITDKDWLYIDFDAHPSMKHFTNKEKPIEIVKQP